MEELDPYRVALIEEALGGPFQLEEGPVLVAVVALSLEQFKRSSNHR